MIVSLIQPPPKRHLFITKSAAFLSEEKIYKAKGDGRELTSPITVSRLSNVNTGMTGPKISSCIALSAQVTPSSTVGSIFSVVSSLPPP